MHSWFVPPTFGTVGSPCSRERRGNSGRSWRIGLADAVAREDLVVKPIEDVVVGDFVWAWNDALTRPVRCRVNRLLRHRGKTVLRVRFRAGSVGEAVDVTSEHPFWVDGKGWVPAGELRPNDFLRRIGRNSDPVRVLCVVDLPRRADVFNFEVDGLHNYFVGREGVLVHNDSSLDAGDGPPVGGPVPAPDPITSPFILIDQLGRPTRAETVRLASRVAIGASLLMAGEHMVEKYRGAYSEAIADAVALEAPLAAYPALRYGLPGIPVPELRTAPEFAPKASPLTWRLPKPEFLAQYEQFRLARDIELAGEPLDSRYEVVESKIRQLLRQGDWKRADGLARDAGIDLTRYNELKDEAYVPKRESPYKQAARALLTDWQFQADLADVGGRALTASPFGKVPVLNGVMERGRMAVSSALWIGYGLSESIDIARYGTGSWSGASSYADAWRKPMWEMAKRGVYNMASEQAGVFLPTSRMREAQSLGRWSMQPDSWGSTATRFVGMAATDTALGMAGSQAIRWWAHGVDPSMPAPFSDGFVPTLVPDGAANALGYTLMYPGVTSRMAGDGGGVPWEYRALVLLGARAIANETYNELTAP